MSLLTSITSRSTAQGMHYLNRVYPLAGVLLSLATVSGLVLFRSLGSDASLTLDWISSELHSLAGIYAYVAITTMGLFVIIGCLIGRKEDRLWESAVTDPGTHLSNRRYFDERLAREMACRSHSGRPLSLLMVDVDRLKAINDKRGHGAGDAAINLVAESLRRTCRACDLAARWGGDEFVIILPGTSARQAFIAANRIRTCLRQLALFPASLVPDLSVSIGVADAEHVRSPEELFASVDRALYNAKEHGRDCVFVARRAWSRPTRPERILQIPRDKENARVPA